MPNPDPQPVVPKKRGGNRGHLTTSHQRAAASKPRVRLPNAKKPDSKLAAIAAALPDSDEDLDAATLRLQRARADCEELDRQKREIDLAKQRAELITREEAVDLAQEASLRLVAILDRLPERIRDLGHPPTPEEVDEIIRAMRTDISQGK